MVGGDGIVVVAEFDELLKRMVDEGNSFDERLESACGNRASLLKLFAVSSDSSAPPGPACSTVLRVSDFLVKFATRNLQLVASASDLDAMMGVAVGRAMASPECNVLVGIIRADSPIRQVLENTKEKRVVIV